MGWGRGRPAAGNLTYSVPIEESIDIFDDARRICSGIAKKARLTMSHESGKIKILAKDEKHTYFKYHRPVNPADNGRFLRFKRNPAAFWLDDYAEFTDEKTREAFHLAE